MVADVCEHSVLIDVLNLHDCALLDKEKVFSFGPGVLRRVTVYLSPLQELLVFLVELLR